MLERFQHNFYLALARNEILSRKGTAFQEFFVEVGHLCWHPDFEGRRAQGSIVDRKCDGYRPSSATVFQCYGPRETKPGPLCTKIAEDYEGAVGNHKSTPIKNWVLVHNDWEELPTTAHETVIRLREKYNVPIEVCAPQNLISLIMELPLNKLMLLFPHGLDTKDLRKIQYQDIDELIASIGPLTPEPLTSGVQAPSAKKLAHNNFSDGVIGILKGGFLVHPRFSAYFADTSRAVVGNRIAEKFKKLYAAQKMAGVEADQVFFALVEALGGLATSKLRSAAIVGLVSYMFHTCEIFEDVPKAAT